MITAGFPYSGGATPLAVRSVGVTPTSARAVPASAVALAAPATVRARGTSSGGAGADDGGGALAPLVGSLTSSSVRRRDIDHVRGGMTCASPTAEEAGWCAGARRSGAAAQWRSGAAHGAETDNIGPCRAADHTTDADAVQPTLNRSRTNNAADGLRGGWQGRRLKGGSRWKEWWKVEESLLKLTRI
eukprot:353852-Chlamydomonas_euryale.AAC.5